MTLFRVTSTRAFQPIILVVLLFTAAENGCRGNWIPADQGAPRPSYCVNVTDRVLSAVATIPAGVSADEARQYYRIPEDAGRFLDEVDFDRFDDPHSQRLYWSAKADAEFAILRATAVPGKQDFVSSYDFMSASLDDIPFCLIASAGISSRQWFEFVDALKAQNVQLSAFEFPVLWTINEENDFEIREARHYREKDLSSATFVDGKFRGVIAVRNGVLQVLTEGADQNDDILEVILHSVSYSDVNGDGFLDAVLRLAVNGSGGVAILTKFGPDQKIFSRVERPALSRTKTGSGASVKERPD